MSEELLEKLLREYGFKLARQKKHRVYKNAAGDTFVTPSTPSDRGWTLNALADLKKLCGPTAEDSRPLRARREHGKLESSSSAGSAPIEPLQAVPEPIPMAPPLSRADQKRLKRREHHEAQRQEKILRQRIELGVVARDVHKELIASPDSTQLDTVVFWTSFTYEYLQSRGYRDVKMAIADVRENGKMVGVCLPIRVGRWFVDILDGELREQSRWKMANRDVEVWSDLVGPDIDELDGMDIVCDRGGWAEP